MFRANDIENSGNTNGGECKIFWRHVTPRDYAHLEEFLWIYQTHIWNGIGTTARDDWIYNMVVKSLLTSVLTW